MEPPKILIVDDHMDVVNLLRFVIQKEGYRFDIAMDGQEALDKIQASMPDLILLDIMLPQMSGFDVLKKLKANPETKDIPVICLTAKWTREDKIRGFELGAVQYLVKPFPIKKMIGIIKSVLEDTPHVRD